MKTVGSRKPASGWDAFNALQKLVTELRQGRPLYPRGVFKFNSHEEAEEWAMKMKNLKTPASRR